MKTLAVLVALCALLSGLFGCKGTEMMNIEKTVFGETDGNTVHLYTLTNDHGMIAKITNYGAIVTELHAPDRNGVFEDIVLGFDTLEGYFAGHPYFGAIAGRVANRIAGGRFTLDGREYQLATNNGQNHLHGGDRGFDKVVWDSEPIEADLGPAVKLTYISKDGEEDYPGELTVEVIYMLTNDNELHVLMTATTDKTTIVNLAQHNYWNLGGHDSGDILNHELMINADAYTPTDDTLIPLGKFSEVKGTPYDFRSTHRIGDKINEIPGDPGGYDDNFVLRGKFGELKLAAKAHDPKSGRRMELFTTEPGVQFYSGNFLDGSNIGKGGAVYHKHNGFCLETQHYPDSINNPDWPSVILKPGEMYHHEMITRLSVK